MTDDDEAGIAFRDLVQGLVEANLERDPRRALRVTKELSALKII